MYRVELRHGTLVLSPAKPPVLLGSLVLEGQPLSNAHSELLKIVIVRECIHVPLAFAGVLEDLLKELSALA